MTLTSPFFHRGLARTIDAFLDVRPGEAAWQQRAQQIADLPLVIWKGRTFHTIRCHGTTGKGPHDTNVPEAVLWSLIDLRAFRCPYH